ncbi:phage repressor protein/antirepressor Ant [Bacillus cereus]|uniref:BRO family protein n=1 Tax=Bacillus cereus group TaxID=86661 RepID=UPI000BF325C1|nr:MULTISPECIES: BRO family protein [Bacillus cereus group]MCU4978785.1 BRO family protein [Bacillus cereus]MED2799546.1 BRO family protein [Bacillus thuringiensis]PFN53348.1 phage repressor protein/antirepressor Ant [Bacillus thuringiensis]QGV08928.1 phage repressor protein/antirepressor Ant [Bacillus cereus]
MTNVQVFENGLGELRLVEERGTTWFIAKDVANILEYSETSAMTRYLDEDELMSVKLTGMNMKSVLVNESGLYSAIMQSKKPQAKAFKKWVTSEILPSIRRDGGYMVAHEEETEEDLIARALILAQKTLARKVKQLEQAVQTLEVQAPKVEYHDKVLNIEGYMTIDETAKELGLRSAQQLNQMLKDKKIIKRSSRGSWLHRAGYEYLKDGYINYKPIEKKKLQMLVSQKGVKEFARLLDLI